MPSRLTLEDRAAVSLGQAELPAIEGVDRGLEMLRGGQ
jgi:hypothetical protein